MHSASSELDFLSIHKQNNGKLKFTKDENGLFKVEILSEVPTRLKGYGKSSIKLKDEIIIDPKTKEKILKDSSRTWVCKHLDTTVSNAEFFTEKVFTKEVLQQIDTHIQPIFNYNSEAPDFSIDDILED